MRCKIFRLTTSLVLVLSIVLSSISVTAVGKETSTVDPQVQLLVDGMSEKSIDHQTKQISMKIGYTPIELVDHSVQTDSLQIDLPDGITYSQENNQSFASIVTINEEYNIMEIDLKQMYEESIILDIVFEQLTDQTSLTGRHYVNGQVIGTTEELIINKKHDVETSMLETESVEKESIIDDTSPSEDGREAALSTREARATLDLGISTTRTLPVAQVTDGQFENVSYFDVGSREEWNDALSIGVSATSSSNNNNKTEITYINITDSFKMSDSTSGAGTMLVRTNRTDKKLIINGNNHSVDFREFTMLFYTNDWDVVFQNITVYNGNDWGVTDLYTPGRKTIITVHNFTQYGAQAFEGSRGRMILSGDTSMTSSPTETYVSPIDGVTVTIDQRYVSGAYRGSSNVAVREIYVKAGSNIMMDNGRLGANFVFFPNGNFYTEDGAATNITMSNLKTPTKSGPWYVNDYAPGNISLVADLSSDEYIWPDSHRPESLIGRSNSIYFGDNTEVEIHNGAPRRDHATVLQMEVAGSSIELGENACFTGLVDETTAVSGKDKTPIYFASTGSIKLGKNASFDLSVGETNDPNKAVGDAIHFVGKASLDLAESSNFKLRSASSNTNGLLKMNTAGSSINIEDQATFDIGFTRSTEDHLFSLNGALNIPAANGYVHRIRLWDNGNFDDAKPDNSFHPLDKTKITYNNTSISSKSTNLADGFVDNGTVSKFNSEYVSKAQRLVIDPIVFNVKSIDELTNETKTEYSVTGTAEPPGGMVELSGGPLDFLSADQRQVTVQADGSYEWKGPLSRPFHWGETIKVSYIGHSDKYLETVVKDVTKPAGKGRTIHVIEGDTIPAIKDFITSVEDTNALETDKDQFGYNFVGSEINSGNVATITNGQDTQEFVDQVVIDDTRGNHSDPVEVKLIVHEADTINSIAANNLMVHWSDVSGFAVGSTEYAQYLKQAMDTQVQTIIDGNIIDLFSNVEVENLASIPNTVGGPNNVKFIVRADSTNQLSADLIKEVQLTIKSNLVDPRDPSTREPKDQENGGTGENGELRLDYVPSTFDLGTREVEWKDMEYQAMGDTDQWIQVADERPAATGWTLKASATPFTSNGDQLLGANLVIPQGEMYNKKTANTVNPRGLVSKGEVCLTAIASEVFSGDGENSKEESTYVWRKNQVKLRVPTGQGQAGKSYSSKITWVVEAGAPN